MFVKKVMKNAGNSWCFLQVAKKLKKQWRRPYNVGDPIVLEASGYVQTSVFPHCNFQRLKSAPSTLILDADFINVAADFVVFFMMGILNPQRKRSVA